MLPPPYKTNCLDYSKIGCLTRIDCIEKCRNEFSKSGNYYSSGKNYGNIFIYMGLAQFHNTLLCEEKYESSDCFSEYYNIKMITDQTNWVKNASFVRVLISDEPDNIITHSPQFYPIELMCFVGGLISLWTGFSIYSVFGYGKWIFRKNKNKIESVQANVGANNTCTCTCSYNKIITRSAFVKNDKKVFQTKLSKMINVQNKENVISITPVQSTSICS